MVPRSRSCHLSHDPIDRLLLRSLYVSPSSSVIPQASMIIAQYRTDGCVQELRVPFRIIRVEQLGQGASEGRDEIVAQRLQVRVISRESLVS
jgi:hypothetical protein